MPMKFVGRLLENRAEAMESRGKECVSRRSQGPFQGHRKHAEKNISVNYTHAWSRANRPSCEMLEDGFEASSNYAFGALLGKQG